jgi:hypothetical protein
MIVANNPEDPIFWSTCYDRVIVKEWLAIDDGCDLSSQATLQRLPFHCDLLLQFANGHELG